MSPENLLSEWSRLLVESLADAGVRDAIVSPGSRSTPLVWALLSCPRIRARSIVDERSAAFFAAGIAKATGSPAVLLCTSGSAALNYFPAIVEASLARTPLVVITADRPFELLDASAPQTIDQTKLYGGYVRRFAELGMPESEMAALVGLRRRILQAVEESLGPEPGPVHLNFRARKPLEPPAGPSPGSEELRTRVAGVLARPATRRARPDSSPPREIVDSIARACASAERGLVVCGPAELGVAYAGTVEELATRCGFPVYAEATSQLRFTGGSSIDSGLLLDGLDVLLRAPPFRDAFTPDLVIQIGEPPVSGAWDRFVAAHPETPRYVFARSGWPDPHGTAGTIVVSDVDRALRGVLSALGGASERRSFAASLGRANAAAWRAVDAVLTDPPALSEGYAVRAVVESLPDGAILALGNSLPVRHADAFVRGGRPRLDVVSQRGASGIDGVVSTASGVAAASGKPTALIVGDLSALHDLGGFAAAASVDTPFVVVVLNNDGGRIFEQLPIAARGIDEKRLEFWTTPHGLGFGPVADLFGLRYEAPSTVDRLREVVVEAASRRGPTLVEIVVPPHGSRELYARLAVRLEAELRPVLAR